MDQTQMSPEWIAEENRRMDLLPFGLGNYCQATPEGYRFNTRGWRYTEGELAQIREKETARQDGGSDGSLGR